MAFQAADRNNWSLFDPDEPLHYPIAESRYDGSGARHDTTLGPDDWMYFEPGVPHGAATSEEDGSLQLAIQLDFADGSRPEDLAAARTRLLRDLDVQLPDNLPEPDNPTHYPEWLAEVEAFLMESGQIIEVAEAARSTDPDQGAGRMWGIFKGMKIAIERQELQGSTNAGP